MPLALLELLGDADVVVDMVMAAAVTVTVTRCRCDESDSAIIIVVLGSIETTASEMCCIESNGRWEIARVASASA